MKEKFGAQGNVLASGGILDEETTWKGDSITTDFDSYKLSTKKLGISGFSPAEDGRYMLVVTKSDAPEANPESQEFFDSVIGCISYKKDQDFEGVIGSMYWEPINSVKVFRFRVDVDGPFVSVFLDPIENCVITEVQ